MDDLFQPGHAVVTTAQLVVVSSSTKPLLLLSQRKSPRKRGSWRASLLEKLLQASAK
jgi:hypothetical protein